jgi:hypothetical protein
VKCAGILTVRAVVSIFVIGFEVVKERVSKVKQEVQSSG